MIRSALQLLHEILLAVRGFFLPKNKLYYSSELDLVFDLELKNLIDFLIYNNGVFQPEVLNRLSYLIIEHNVSTFIDIGSHIGQMSIFVAKNHPQLKVFSYEPNPDTYKRQRKNIHLNGVTVEAKNMGFSHEAGSLKFRCFRNKRLSEYYKINDGICFPISDKNQADFETQCILLDELVDSIDGQDSTLIKIDVEGYEKKILEGADHFLKTKDVILLIELLFDLYRQNSLDCVELLSSYGFKMYDLELRNVNIAMDETKNGDYIFLKQ